jgi:outer membrane immunogenic protein
MKCLSLLATAALAVAATPVLAQDGDAATVSSFTGPRAEIFGGWDRPGSRTTVISAAPEEGGEPTVIREKSHKDGGVAGGLIGYDMPIGDRFIVGAFGSYALPTAKTCIALGEAGGGCVSTDHELEAGARAGAKIGSRAMVYAKGAYVRGRFKSRFGDGVDYVTDHDNRNGWRAGAGVEFALNKHAYVKAEYDYTRFKSFDTVSFDGDDARVRMDRNQVLAGFGLRF